MTDDEALTNWPWSEEGLRALPSEVGDDLLEGTVTIGFADLVDSTGLVQAIGDVAYTTLIREIDALSRSLAQPRRGHVPRHEGDGWMVVFGAARRALWWAAELQEAVVTLSARAGVEVVLRIGLHTGEAVQDGLDFHGLHVNYAARVASATPGGAVYVTSLTAQIARGAREFTFTNPQLIQLRGFDEPAELLELDWPQLLAHRTAIPNQESEQTLN